ncbi:hypothetical protein ACGFI4_01615 [Micromonospora carbonacea]|uniref:hypothetical protein n=1 Tax=Micromonospora carbonacea TaxID=47853 RepID=UPI003723DB98
MPQPSGVGLPQLHAAQLDPEAVGVPLPGTDLDDLQGERAEAEAVAALLGDDDVADPDDRGVGSGS